MTDHDTAYNRGDVQRALQAFRECRLGPAEELVAAADILKHAISRFRKDAAAYRDAVGDHAAAEFARHEFNDIINDLQDTIGPAVRTYNSLLRDRDADPGEIPG